MIEKLPLLPSDHGTWEWTQSNGQATDEQTQLAYAALLNQGLCSDFSRLVWNDLVDMTEGTLGTAGLVWDPKYASAAGCRINGSLGAMTAAAFNSVAHQIHRLGFVDWRWAKNNGMPGHVGRNAFRGYSQYKEDSDLLYGWHIIELAKKLNRMLEVLKNEADFSELEKSIRMISFQDSGLNASGSAVLNHMKVSESCVSAPLVSLRVAAQSAFTAGWSSHKGVLVRKEPAIMIFNSKTYSAVMASGESLKTQAVQSKTRAQTFVDAVLTDLVFVGYLRCANAAMTQTRAELEASNICDMELAEWAGSLAAATLLVSEVTGLCAAEHMETMGLADLILLDGLRLSAGNDSYSYGMADMVLGEKVPVTGTERITSIQDSVLEYQVPQYIRSARRALSLVRAAASVITPGMLKGVVSAGTIVGTAVHIVQPAKINSSAEGISSTGGSELVNSNPLKMLAKGQIKSGSQGILQKGIPVAVDAEVMEQTAAVGEIKILPGEKMSAGEYVRSANSAEIRAADAEQLQVMCRSAADCVAVLELEYNPYGEWKAPVRAGNNLYLRSVYPQWKEGSNVHLDSGGTFYDPVQTEYDVYIRSSDSMKGW